MESLPPCITRSVYSAKSFFDSFLDSRPPGGLLVSRINGGILVAGSFKNLSCLLKAHGRSEANATSCTFPFNPRKRELYFLAGLVIQCHRIFLRYLQRVQHL